MEKVEGQKLIDSNSDRTSYEVNKGKIAVCMEVLQDNES